MRSDSASPIAGVAVLQAPNPSPETNVNAPTTAAATMNLHCLPDFASVVCCFIAPPCSRLLHSACPDRVRAVEREAVIPGEVEPLSSMPPRAVACARGWRHSAATWRRAQMFRTSSRLPLRNSKREWIDPCKRRNDDARSDEEGIEDGGYFTGTLHGVCRLTGARRRLQRFSDGRILRVSVG